MRDGEHSPRTPSQRSGASPGDELVSTCVLLLNAGHEATVNMLGNGWLALLRDREQLGLLRECPSPAQRVVEKILRYDTPLQMFERRVLQDVEICGMTLPKGAEPALLLETLRVTS
ncbi:MAG: hypothetical protein ACRDYX_08590 [Egibacteraceae bacterium]